MNILLIACNLHYRDWLGKTYFDILTYYKNNSKNNVKLVYFDEIVSIDTIKNFNPHIITCFDTGYLNLPNIYNFIFQLKIPVFYCGLDLFYLELIKKNCPNIAKCNGIIHFSQASKLENSYKYYFPEKKILNFNGRFVNTERFKNYNKEKIYDILIYGVRDCKNNIDCHDADKDYKIKYEKHYNKELGMTHNFYPLRKKIEDLIIENSKKYRIYIVKPATIFNGDIANESLSELINQSYLTLSCCTRADIAMAKYFEIPASYSAILGDIPSDYNHLFKNNIVEVNEWMSDEKILNIIDKALENKDKLWEMTKRLGDRVHEEYNLEAGTKNMDDVFTSIFQ